MAIYIDEIESEVLSWKGVSLHMHKYGGTQFNLRGKEIGHIHGNGLLDVLFDRATRDQLLKEGRITHHHVFKNSGWISFYVKTSEDKEYAILLLDRAYKNLCLRLEFFSPTNKKYMTTFVQISDVGEKYQILSKYR